MTARDPSVEEPYEAGQEEEEEGLDLEGVKDALGYFKRAPGRRPKLAAGVLISVAAIGLTLAVTMPRTYNVTVRLLAQRTALSSLGDPNHPNQGEGSLPSAVAALAARRDSMIDVITETNLVERFWATRPAALRFKDTVMSYISQPLSEQDKVRAMVGTLEKRVKIFADEQTITISVDWSDPKVAYDMASLIQKNFLDARYDTEVAMIQDGIHGLEEHAKSELEGVDQALADYEALRAARLKVANGGPDDVAAPATGPVAGVGLAAPAGRPAAAAIVASGPDPDLAKSLEDTRRQIRAIEDDRQRQLESLRQQLTQAQLTLTPMHPTVIALQKSVDSFTEPSPQLQQLKAQERMLMTQIAAPLPPAPAPGGGSAPAPRSYARAPIGGGLGRPDRNSAESEMAEERREHEDPTLTPAREHLSDTINRYQAAMQRIDSAKLDLDMTRRALRYRWSVATPAEMPRGPTKPLGMIMGLASLLGAVFLAFLAAAVADFTSGKLLEAWEVRRRLKIEVLSELEPPTENA